MRFLKTTGIVFIALTFSACHLDSLSPEPGDLTTTTRTVSGFSGLTVESGIQTTVVKGATESVTIETREGYQPYIITEVINGVLRIRLDRRIRSNRVVERRAVVTMKTLTSLNTSGGVRLTSNDDFKPARLTMQVSGGGYVGLPLTADALTISSSGGSEIDVSGAVNAVSVPELSGGSRLKLLNLAATTGSIDASGGSVADVNVSRQLTVTASGGSIIRYRGSPTVAQTVSGGSSVRPF